MSRLWMRQSRDPPAPALDLAAREKKEAARVIGSGAIFLAGSLDLFRGSLKYSVENSDGIFYGIFRGIFCRRDHPKYSLKYFRDWIAV